MAGVIERAAREALVAEYQRSGTSQRVFAAKHGINPTTFGGWVARVKRQERQGVAKQAGGLTELVAAGRGDGAAEMDWPCCLEVCGVTIRFRAIPEASWVCEVLRASIS